MVRLSANLLIMECTIVHEDMFEGRMLKEYFRILQSRIPTSGRVRYVKIRNRNHFLSTISRAKEKYIHISAHGKFSKRKKITSLVLPYGNLTSTDIREKLDSKLKNKNLFVNACEAAHSDMAYAFVDCGCRYFVAPLRRVEWVDAAVFAVLFYRALFIDHKDVPSARDYVEKLRNIKGCYNVWAS